MHHVQPQQLNRLWIARQRSGLGQKNVARLLGHKTLSVISEYERGRILPNLRAALKLSAIYRMPLKELYAPLYAEIEQEVETARKKLPSNCYVSEAATTAPSPLPI